MLLDPLPTLAAQRTPLFQRVSRRPYGHHNVRGFPGRRDRRVLVPEYKAWHDGVLSNRETQLEAGAEWRVRQS
jgi:hypothetical protein